MIEAEVLNRMYCIFCQPYLRLVEHLEFMEHGESIVKPDITEHTMLRLNDARYKSLYTTNLMSYYYLTVFTIQKCINTMVSLLDRRKKSSEVMPSLSTVV